MRYEAWLGVEVRVGAFVLAEEVMGCVGEAGVAGGVGAGWEGGGEGGWRGGFGGGHCGEESDAEGGDGGGDGCVAELAGEGHQVLEKGHRA